MAPVEEAILNISVVPAAFCNVKRATKGVVVPIAKKLETVLVPVTAKVLEPVVKVKFVEVAKVFVPAPNRISLVVIFWS